mmetsp:Transcript_26153/g.44979  ORF Transcript_26153/g.44979 Transcript_26153/m.44979 type:complete len:110 (-) Transcript_26153:8-337(-)
MRRFCTSVCLLLIVLQSVHSLSWNIEPTTTDIFYEEIKTGSKISGSFHVSSGGMLDIDFKVLSPSNEELYSVQKNNEAKFAFTAEESGVFQFIFANTMSTLTVKTVTLV